MSYTTGTAGDAAALRSAIFAACVADGWTLTSDILSKGTHAIRIELNTVSTATGLRFTGGKGQAAGALVDACPNHVSLGDRTNFALAYPVTYHVFSFAASNEVYVVVNHNVDFFQWAAWGQSVHSLPGNGLWFGASLAQSAGSPITSVYMRNDGSVGSFTWTSPGLFWRNATAAGAPSAGYQESCMHHGFDGDVWSVGGPTAPGVSATDAANPLMSMLPNAWNAETVLVPIQALAKRPSNMASLVASLVNARYVRVDNYAPGDLITLGADRWMVFPWLRKNASVRNGDVGAITTNLHSGTLGWAIRYDGP